MIQNKDEEVSPEIAEEKKILPEISFGYLERSVCNEMMGYIFVITLSFPTKEDEMIISNKLGQVGLEYFIIENDPEYQILLNMEKGLGLYVKKHEISDLDYSNNFVLGHTVYETYKILLDVLEKYYKSPIFLKEDAVEKLKKFKEKLTQEIDWGTIIIAMPELLDFDEMLNALLEQKKNDPPIILL